MMQISVQSPSAPSLGLAYKLDNAVDEMYSNGTNLDTNMELSYPRVPIPRHIR